jgi:hypothetical protein
VVIVTNERIWNESTTTLVAQVSLPSAMTLTCGKTMDVSNKFVTIMTCTGLCPSGTCPAGKFTILFSGGIINPDYVKPVTGDFTLHI